MEEIVRESGSMGRRAMEPDTVELVRGPTLTCGCPGSMVMGNTRCERPVEKQVMVEGIEDAILLLTKTSYRLLKLH
jgi:hypothetical protein